MEFNADPISDSNISSEALLGFSSAMIDMLTNLSASESDVAGAEDYGAVLERVRSTVSALDSTEKELSIATILGNAFKIFVDTHVWRTSVNSPSEDWVSYFHGRWSSVVPRNDTMNSFSALLARFPEGSEDRINLLRHVTNVSEQAALIFAYRAPPVSKKTKQRVKRKEIQARKKTSSKIFEKVAENTTQMCNNPAIVRRMTDMARSLVEETMPGSTDQDPAVLDEIVQMSMKMAPSLISSVTQGLDNGNVDQIVGKKGRKKLEKLARRGNK